MSTLEENQRRLDEAEGYSEVWQTVKDNVKTILNKQRRGMLLFLDDMPLRLGAYHHLGTNNIVLNRSLIQIVEATTKSRKLLNAFVYTLLLHEYLHSLGYVDEEEVRELTQEVCMLALGKAHPATVMAERGVDAYFPKVTYFTEEFPLPESFQVELVKDFDRSSVGYIH